MKTGNPTKYEFLRYHDASEGVPLWFWLIALAFLLYVSLRVYFSIQAYKNKKQKK